MPLLAPVMTIAFPRSSTAMQSLPKTRSGVHHARPKNRHERRASHDQAIIKQ
jgi:hypothetical protein